jgi:hypothetical protein
VRWFADSGVFPRPVSVAGWLVVLAGLAICVAWFLMVDAGSHSASDTLYGVVPVWVVVALAVRTVAAVTKGRPAGSSDRG